MTKGARRLFDYFLVCGLGPELQTMLGLRGFQGTGTMYMPSLLDQFPPASGSSCAPPPPQLPLCVLPGGVEFYPEGRNLDEDSSQPRSYPIVLTDGDGSKIYVSCVAFHDPVDDDVAQAYRIPANSYVDKCICVVSHSPSFRVFREVLEELHRMCFSTSGCSKPLWEILAHMVNAVPLPTPGESQVLFSVENYLICVDVPPKDGLPHADMSFQPLMQCLDIDNVIRLFIAVLLERRVLLRANKYSLLTMVAEAVCHLIYPIKWQHVYIPVLFFGGVDYVEAPTPYLMGLHSGVDTSSLSVDGVVVVDLVHNLITTSEDIPSLPELELKELRSGLLQLLYPNLADLDCPRKNIKHCYDSGIRRFNKVWGEEHDCELRLLFLKVFASILSGYRDFVDTSNTAINVFNAQAFLKKRSRVTSNPPEPMFKDDEIKVRDGTKITTCSLTSRVQSLRISSFKDQDSTCKFPSCAHSIEHVLSVPLHEFATNIFVVVQLLSSQGFYDFLERGYGSSLAGPNLLDKLQEALNMGQNAWSILPVALSDPEIINISDASSQSSAARSRYLYDRFPTNVRTEAQEEKRKAILTTATANLERPARPVLGPSISSPPSMAAAAVAKKMESLSPRERAAERERMVLDIKVKLQGLWRRLLEMGATDDPLSSSEYGTILALIESDAEGIGGSGFVECIGEHIHSGWACQLSEEQFTAVKELIKTTIGRAMSRNDMSTVRDALEISAEVYRKDARNISDYVQRHLGALPVWDDLRFWEGYFEFIIERSSEKVGNYAALVTEQLSVLAEHMAGLGIPDTEAWFILESIAQKNNLGSKQLIKLRGLLAHSQQVRQGYWGISVNRSQASSGQTQGFHSQQLQGQTTESNQSSEGTAGVGRSWVHSMFSRDRASLAQPAARTRSRSENALMATAKENARADASQGIKRGSSGVRILRGHKAAITALHAVTKSEAGELFGDYEDAGYFISGSADCTVKTWDPALRGSELRTTFEGHTGAVRAISSDRLRVVSGSDDQRVLVWDKSTSQLLEELKGHDAAVICIRMLSGERVLTASHDASVKMWDVRTDTCVATVGRTASAILCMDYDDTTGVLAAAGMDGVGNVWDVRAGKQLHKLIGHTKWIRSLRMVGDTMVTGSDDWTARVWSISRGTCDAVLACHAGGVTCVDYCSTDNGILTGSVDGMVKIWEREDGSLQCTKNVGLHTAAILSVKAGPKWMAIGAADNSMSLFHRQEQRSNVQPNDLGGQASGWQLHRTPQRSAAVVRCVASDVERGRICTGARSGLLRLWDPVSG